MDSNINIMDSNLQMEIMSNLPPTPTTPKNEDISEAEEIFKTYIKTIISNDSLSGEKNYQLPQFLIPKCTFNKYNYENPSNLNWITNDNIKYPSFCDKICYYINCLYNNDSNKIEYLEFKSKMYILVNTGSSLLNMVNNLQYVNNKSNYDEVDQKIINMFQLADQYILKYSNLLTLSHSPFKLFLENYFINRNTILRLDNKYSDNYTHNRLKMATKTTYAINKLDILLESVKTSIDNNDQLLFKILVLIMNSLIILAEYAWKYYWIDGDSYGHN